MVVSADLSKMNHVKWVDHKSMMACAEVYFIILNSKGGIVGSDLEKELKKYNVVMGHEPDSIEFSTLGGWVATKASGMKKNRYGNIEDLSLLIYFINFTVISVKVVTPQGTIERANNLPRESSGPDLT